MINLHCEKCHDIVGQEITDAAGKTFTLISVKVRSKRRRRYVVQHIESVECDRCGHVGVPLPRVLGATIESVECAHP